jgi:hypothetical protein
VLDAHEGLAAGGHLLAGRLQLRGLGDAGGRAEGVGWGGAEWRCIGGGVGGGGARGSEEAGSGDRLQGSSCGG